MRSRGWAAVLSLVDGSDRESRRPRLIRPTGRGVSCDVGVSSALGGSLPEAAGGGGEGWVMKADRSLPRALDPGEEAGWMREAGLAFLLKWAESLFLGVLFFKFCDLDLSWAFFDAAAFLAVRLLPGCRAVLNSVGM